jgi:hypothetical protein
MEVPHLAELLKETSIEHGNFEAVTPPHDWWDWYAPYLSARKEGKSQDEAIKAADSYMKEARGIERGAVA